ncbi:TrbC/VIRB2 family protein [uncultured archaeon]|nr:TrbC/VIRB2 family protein [uncultured archaeon]
MDKKYYSIIGLVLLVAMFALQFVVALDFNQTISASDKATFDSMLSPVMKIYNMVKYFASAIAVVVLLFAGITYITSGNDPGKREQAKNMAMYVVIGLIVIWLAPLIVNFIVGS